MEVGDEVSRTSAFNIDDLYFVVCFFVTDIFSPRQSTNPVRFARFTQLIENVGAFGEGIGVETVEIVNDIVEVGIYHGAEAVEG